MVVRNEEKGQRALTEIQKLYPEAKLELMLMDMASMDSIRRASAEIIDKAATIDVLVNAAGLFNTKPDVTKDGYDITYGVNYLGTYLFTMLLIDKMRETAKKTGDVRIVSISSFGHTNKLYSKASAGNGRCFVSIGKEWIMIKKNFVIEGVGSKPSWTPKRVHRYIVSNVEWQGTCIPTLGSTTQKKSFERWRRSGKRRQRLRKRRKSLYPGECSKQPNTDKGS